MSVEAKRTRSRTVSSASRPLGALISQGIVAASSLVLQFIALNKLGASGLGSFSLLFGILITVNSIQSGWIGDSLTVLDRFEPGIRRALIQSQVIAVVLVLVVTTGLALPVGGVDATTAMLFGLASVMWVIEETFRRLLIARREFWKLVVNDASFALGSFAMLAFVGLSGKAFTLETLVLSLFAGAVVAIAVGVVQLPRIELSRGLLARSRMRDLASFAFWRAAQIGLRPGSQAAVRAIVATAVSLEALGQLETARLLLAPVLTAVNGAGVYLLPTYSRQAKKGKDFRPSVPTAMFVVGGMAAAYGALALALRTPLIDLLNEGSTVITAAALFSWSLYSIGFGAGIPAGNAMVATGRSRTAFGVRCADASVGVATAALFAFIGWVDFVPAGLALGTAVGASLLLRALDQPTGTALPSPSASARVRDHDDLLDVDDDVDIDDAPWVWHPAPITMPRMASPVTAPDDESVITAPEPRKIEAAARTEVAPRRRQTLQQRLLWLVPIFMIVATEFKIRTRDIDDALAGSIDPLIALELLIYGVIGGWVVWRLAPTKPRLTPLTLAMWGYILTTAVSSLYSTFPMLGMARAVQLVIIGAVIHLIAVDGTLSTMTRLLHAWIALMSVSILMGLAYVAPTRPAQRGRFTWLSVHSVSAGSMLAISVCVLFGLWLSAGRKRLMWSRGTYGLLLVFQLLFLLLTRTRGSIGGAFIALAVMAWVWSGNKMKPQLLLGSLVAAGALVLAFGGPIFEFLTRGESAESFGTFNRRTEIWTLAWDSFLSHPLHGLGFTSAKGVFFDETGLGGAHNALINVMIDAGLVGLTWWLALIVGAIATLGRQWGSQRHATRLRTMGRPSTSQSGAAGSAQADHLILMGMFVATLLNSVTTEGLGAGVNVSAIWLFISVAWLTILDRRAILDQAGTDAAERSVESERSDTRERTLSSTM